MSLPVVDVSFRFRFLPVRKRRPSDKSVIVQHGSSRGPEIILKLSQKCIKHRAVSVLGVTYAQAVQCTRQFGLE